MDVLITGATGFLGSRLALAALKQGRRVRLFTQANDASEEATSHLLEAQGADVVLASVTDADAVREAVTGMHVVFDLAAAQAGDVYLFSMLRLEMETALGISLICQLMNYGYVLIAGMIFWRWRRAGAAASDAGSDIALRQVVDYWNSHLNSTQFLAQGALEEGSPEFFRAIEASYRRFPYKPALLDWIASLKGGKLLEMGCGLGIDLAELAARGLKVTGIDIAPRAVELSRRHLEFRGLVGDVRLGNCESMDLPCDSFDIVYSSGVLLAIPDIAAGVRELLRVLRPGGTFVVILYHRYSWFNLLRKLSGTNVEFEDADAPIIRTFSKRELRRLFQAARDLKITMEHYRPSPTTRRGWLSVLFNRLFVPCYGALPAWLIRPFGWHAVVTGRKP